VVVWQGHGNAPPRPRIEAKIRPDAGTPFTDVDSTGHRGAWRGKGEGREDNVIETGRRPDGKVLCFISEEFFIIWCGERWEIWAGSRQDFYYCAGVLNRRLTEAGIQLQLGAEQWKTRSWLGPGVRISRICPFVERVVFSSTFGSRGALGAMRLRIRYVRCMSAEPHRGRRVLSSSPKYISLLRIKYFGLSCPWMRWESITTVYSYIFSTEQYRKWALHHPLAET